MRPKLLSLFRDKSRGMEADLCTLPHAFKGEMQLLGAGCFGLNQQMASCDYAALHQWSSWPFGSTGLHLVTSEMVVWGRRDGVHSKDLSAVPQGCRRLLTKPSVLLNKKSPGAKIFNKLSFRLKSFRLSSARSAFGSLFSS